MKFKKMLKYLRNKRVTSYLGSLAMLLTMLVFVAAGMKTDFGIAATQVHEEQYQIQAPMQYFKPTYLKPNGQQVTREEFLKIRKEQQSQQFQSSSRKIQIAERDDGRTLYVDTRSNLNLNVRKFPFTDSQIIGKLTNGTKVTITAEATEHTPFFEIVYNGGRGYIHSKFTTETEPVKEEIISNTSQGSVRKTKKPSAAQHSITYGLPSGVALTSKSGTVQGPSGKETYYNLNMSRVVQGLKNMGVPGDYWVRADGAKMYGEHIIVAANLSLHPRGSIVQTSMGTGIVADTGGFAATNPTQIDIATTW